MASSSSENLLGKLLFSMNALPDRIDKALGAIEEAIEKGDQQLAGAIDASMNMKVVERQAKASPAANATTKPQVSSVSKTTATTAAVGSSLDPALFTDFATQHLELLNKEVDLLKNIDSTIEKLAKGGMQSAAADSAKPPGAAVGDIAGAGGANVTKAIKTADKNVEALAKTKIGENLSKFFDSLKFDESQSGKLSDAMAALENVFSITEKLEEGRSRKKKASFLDVVQGRQRASDYLKAKFEDTKAGIKELESQVKALSKSSIAKHLSNFFNQFKVQPEQVQAVNESLQMFTKLTEFSKSGLKLFKVALVIKMVDKMHLGHSIARIINAIASGVKDVEKAAAAVEIMKTVSSRLFLFSISLAASLPFLLIGMMAMPMLKKVLNGLSVAFSHIGKNAKEVMDGAKAMAKVTMFFVVSVVALMAAGAIVSAGAQNVLIGLGMLAMTAFVFAQIGKKGIQILLAGKAVRSMAVAMVMFGVGLTAMAFLVSMNPMGAILGLGMLAITAMLFHFIGSSKYVDNGARAIIMVGLSLALFGIGVFILSELAMKNPIGTMFSLILIGMTSILFHYIGQEFMSIAKGAVAVILIGLSLIIFSVGLKMFADATKDMTWEKGGVMALVLGGAIALYAAAGYVATQMIMGSVAFILAGISMIVLGLGMQVMAKVPWGQIDAVNMGLTLGAIVIGFAAAGAAAMFMIPGALAMGAVGLALGAVASGITAWNAAKVENFDVDKAQRIITGISQAFAAAGQDEAPGGLLGLLTGVKLGKNNVARGIESVLDADKALTSLAKGLRNFEDLTRDMNLEDPKKNPDSLVARVGNVIGMVSKVFSEIGASGNTNKSIIGAIFGSDFKQSDTEVGIDSVMSAGKALAKIAQGIRDFKDKTDGLDLNPATVGSVAWNVAAVIGMINTQFSAIGSNGTQGGSLIKSIFGGDFSESAVEQGIESVDNAGRVLREIAEGLAKWVDLEKMGIVWGEMNPDGTVKTTGIIPNIQMTLGMVRTAFAAIGDEKTAESQPIWSFITGDENIVQKGIDTVKDLGGTLKDIALGLAEWSKLDGMKIVWGKIDKDGNVLEPGIIPNIQMVIGMLRKAFATIGESKSVDSGLFGFLGGDDNIVQKGIESVKGAGEELSNIANGLKVFHEMVSSKGFSLDAVKTAVVWALTMVREQFALIGDAKGQQIQSGGMTFTMSDDNLVKKGVDAVSGAGEELKNIADALKVFHELTSKKMDITKIGENITGILNVVRLAFAAVGGDANAMKTMKYEFPTTEEAVQKGIKSVAGAGEQLKDIADSVKTFAEANKSGGMNIDTIKATISGILQTVATEFAALADADVAARIGYKVSITPEAIEKGAEVGKNAVDALSDMARKMENLKPISESWPKIKPVIPELFKVPIGSLGELAMTLDIPKTVSFLNVVAEPVRQLLDRFATTYQKYVQFSAADKRDKKEGGALGKFSVDTASLYKTLKEKLGKQEVDHFRLVTDDLVKVAKVATEFERFVKSYKEFVAETKNLVEHVNKFEVEKLVPFSTTLGSIKDLALVPTAQFAANAQLAETVVKTIMAALTPVLTGGGGGQAPSDQALLQWIQTNRAVALAGVDVSQINDAAYRNANKTLADAWAAAQAALANSGGGGGGTAGAFSAEMLADRIVETLWMKTESHGMRVRIG